MRVLDPQLLDEIRRREYYIIVSGPMKTHIKKADKQLEKTANRIRPQATRVLWIINTECTALTRDEFKDICIKCARNDTNIIDWLISSGIYYHSDGFDHWVLTSFEEFSFNVARSFPSRKILLQQWSAFLNEAIAAHMRSEESFDSGKMPVIDLAFELDGVRFVKPAPPLPPSNFWPGGRRPRNISVRRTMQNHLRSAFPNWAKRTGGFSNSP